jgi:hypothetical protein
MNATATGGVHYTTASSALTEGAKLQLAKIKEDIMAQKLYEVILNFLDNYYFRQRRACCARPCCCVCRGLTRPCIYSVGVPGKGDTYKDFDSTSWGQKRLTGNYNAFVTPACPANDVVAIFPQAVENAVLARVAAWCEFVKQKPLRSARSDEAPRPYADDDATVEEGEVMLLFSASAELAGSSRQRRRTRRRKWTRRWTRRRGRRVSRTAEERQRRR